MLAAVRIENAARAARSSAGPKVKVVLVLFNYGEISTEELLGGTDAVLMAYMPHTATAAAEVLFGAISPSGRLPYTICKDALSTL